MKGLRFLLLGMAICLASGMKAQFYDGPDDIYYYVELKDGEMSENSHVLIFNFDGMKAAILDWTNMMGCKPPHSLLDYVRNVKNEIKENPTIYEERVETCEYDIKYIGSNTYQYKGSTRSKEDKEDGSSLEYINFNFSYDRNTLNSKWHYWNTPGWGYAATWKTEKRTYKKVDKSFFKVGRSRTPSGTMHE